MQEEERGSRLNERDDRGTFRLLDHQLQETGVVVIVHSSVLAATFEDDGGRGLTSDYFPPIDSTQPFAHVSLLASQRESPTKSW